MGCKEFLQLAIVHLDGAGVLVQELDLLHHASAHDLVVTIEPQGEPFAKQNLAAHVLIEQELELRLRRSNAVLLSIDPCDPLPLRRTCTYPVAVGIRIEVARSSVDQ